VGGEGDVWLGGEGEVGRVSVIVVVVA